MTAADSLDGTEWVEIAQLSDLVTITANTISVNGGTNSFLDSGNGFVAAGFAEGDNINVVNASNSGNNIFTGIITAMGAGSLQIGGTDGDSLVDESAGASITIAKWTTRRVQSADIGGALTASSLGTLIHGLTNKVTPVDADEFTLADSAASWIAKHVTWANIKATLKTYFDGLYQPIDATLTALAGLATGANKIPYSTGTDTFDQLDFSTNTALGTSDTTIPSQKAIKAYVDALLAANDAFVVKGSIDCSANPNYPAADAGHVYRVSVAGLIGGGSGAVVQAGDTLTCYVDSSASGTQAAVGANWTITQVNIDGALFKTTAPTNHGILLGTGASNVGVTAAMTNGQILVGATGADPAPQTMSGDATLSSGGALTVANDAISYAKMQNVSATSRILGRKTAGSGDVEECTLTEVLDFVGSAAQGDILYRDASSWARLAAGTAAYILKTGGSGANPSWAAPPCVLAIACSDETTALATGTNKAKFINPFATAFNVTAVVGSLSTAQASGSIFTVDVNEAGTSILSTKLTIDNTETNSSTAAAAPVISDASIAAYAEIEVDIDQIGDGTAKGLKVYLIGYPS